MKKFSSILLFFAALLVVGFYSSCKDDNDDDMTDEVRSRFTYDQDDNDPFTFSFMNESLNATSYAWDFGDGSTSTETSPTHTYAEGGNYDVKLTAMGTNGTNTSNETISVTDPDAELSKLAGTGADGSKAWKLLRQVDSGQYPIQVGPASRAEIWWALGLNDPLDTRTCMMEEEYIFYKDGKYEYDAKGMIYAEEAAWPEDISGKCIDETDGSLLIGADGSDLSPWASGTHSYTFNSGESTLKLSGLGAHVGLAKVGTDAEYTQPQLEVTYKVIGLSDGDVDTLILETAIPGGYWQFILVHYDNPADEPELPSSPPSVGFTFEVDGNTVTFTNTSGNADSYNWNFGDGGSSAEENPVYTYGGEGSFEVTLTATNDNGVNSTMQTIVISSATLNMSSLTNDGSKVWILNPAAGALAVGPAKGSGEWFQTSDEDVTTGRPCIFNDEYLFTSDGDYLFDTKGDVFGEPYMGIDPAGCVSESALSSDAAHWGSGNHMFSFTEATGSEPAYLTVTGTGAFIGLPKAYNGGEYTAAPPTENASVTYEVLSYVNDGTTEKMVLTVDISEGQVGGSYWSFTLIAQ